MGEMVCGSGSSESIIRAIKVWKRWGERCVRGERKLDEQWSRDEVANGGYGREGARGQSNDEAWCYGTSRGEERDEERVA